MPTKQSATCRPWGPSIADVAGRVSTHGYSSTANLTTIKHGMGTADEATTTLGYAVASQLQYVTNPNGKRSAIRCEVKHRWAHSVRSDTPPSMTD